MPEFFMNSRNLSLVFANIKEFYWQQARRVNVFIGLIAFSVDGIGNKIDMPMFSLPFLLFVISSSNSSVCLFFLLFFVTI